MTSLFSQETISPELINEMRCWIQDCCWTDIDEGDADELSDQEILKGIKRHYSGGIAQFIADATP